MMNLTWGRHDEPPVLNAGGGGGGGLASTYNFFKSAPGAALTRITRPNNATPYVAGQVYGDAVDARQSFVVPALPADARLTIWGSLVLTAVQGCPPTAGACNISMVVFSAQPATILGDGAALALSDADIALMPSSSLSTNNIWQFPAGAVANAEIINQSAGAAGRRALPGTFIGGGSSAQTLVPGNTVWFYLRIQNAYTPTALETLDLYTNWLYTPGVAAV